MAYAAGRSGARLYTHTTQALATGRYPFLSFTRAAGIQKNTRMKLNIRVLHIYYLVWRLPISGPQGWRLSGNWGAKSPRDCRRKDSNYLATRAVLSLWKHEIKQPDLPPLPFKITDSYKQPRFNPGTLNSERNAL